MDRCLYRVQNSACKEVRSFYFNLKDEYLYYFLPKKN
jgi:hypothetical protein